MGMVVLKWMALNTTIRSVDMSHKIGIVSMSAANRYRRGRTLNYQKQAPKRAQADKLVAARLGTAMTTDASLLLISAADDERNAPKIKITETRVKNGKTYLIQASEQASGIPRRATPGFLQAADPGADR